MLTKAPVENLGLPDLNHWQEQKTGEKKRESRKVEKKTPSCGLLNSMRICHESFRIWLLVHFAVWRKQLQSHQSHTVKLHSDMLEVEGADMKRNESDRSCVLTSSNPSQATLCIMPPPLQTEQAEGWAFDFQGEF